MQSAVRRTVAALTLSTALIGSSAALAAPANAEKWVHQDAAGDVMRVSMDEQQPAPEPGRTSVDVTKVVAKHQGRALTIKVRTRGRMSGMQMMNGTIRTPRKRLALMAMRVPGLMNGVGLLDFDSKRRDPEVKCRGLKRSYDESRTVMTLTIPRSCIGNPKWVRFSLVLSTMDPFADDPVSYDDDALREGISPWGAGKMSPKLRHG